MRPQRSHRLALALAAASAWPRLTTAQTSAQTPTQTPTQTPSPHLPPLRILVGAPPGGSTDTLARELAPEMDRQLGRAVIIDNRSGAGASRAMAERRWATAPSLAAFIQADVARWTQLVKYSGAKPE